MMQTIYRYIFLWLLRKMIVSVKISSGRRVYEWTHRTLSIAVAVSDTSVDGFDRFDRVDTLLMLRQVRRQEKLMGWNAPDQVGVMVMRMEFTIGSNDQIMIPVVVRHLIKNGYAVMRSPDGEPGRFWTTASRQDLITDMEQIGLSIISDERSLPDGQRISYQNGMVP